MVSIMRRSVNAFENSVLRNSNAVVSKFFKAIYSRYRCKRFRNRSCSFSKEIKQMLSNKLLTIVALFQKQHVNTLLLAKKCQRSQTRLNTFVAIYLEKLSKSAQTIVLYNGCVRLTSLSAKSRVGLNKQLNPMLKQYTVPVRNTQMPMPFRVILCKQTQ